MNISNSQVKGLQHSARSGLRSLYRPEPQTAVEWADENYYLPKESAYQEGRWETLPFQRAIMNAMGNDYIREVNVVKSARVGYSKMLLGVYAYFIQHKQRNSLIWLPTDGDAENFMKSHVEPTIRDIPSLLALAPWYGKKHRDNTLSMKRFSNGRGFWCLGGKAAKNYREKSVDVAGYDELAAFDDDIEKEGSPTFLGDKRIEGSVWPKSIRGSTPKIKGTCQIERAAKESEHFLRFYVPCPHCGEEQFLKFGDKETPFGFKWTPGDPASVIYLCEHNACVIKQQELDFSQARYICDETGIWTRDGLFWFSSSGTSAQGFSVQGIYSGSYDVRVRALNAQDTSSPWGYAETTYLSGKTGKPGTPLNFLATEDVVWHIDLTWKFPDGSGDTAYTEIQRATTSDFANPELLVLVPYPAADYQHGPMPAGVRQWYRARLIDRIGNAGDWTDWVMGTSSIDVSEITNDILEDMKDSDTFKDLIENAVDSNEKVAGMADDIKKHADELEQQAKDIQENADGLAQAEVKIDEISVSMDGMTGGVKNSAIAIIQANLAQVATRKTLSASVAGNSAQLDRIDEVIVTDREATARALLSLQTNVNGNTASINSLSQTVSNYQQATATQINAITATVNGHTSSITTNAQAIANVNGQLSAMYSIKVGLSSNGQYYAAGMGIGVENTPSGMQSQVIFLADRFAVTHQAGAEVTLPFVIQNGQTIIRDTVIGDGTIGNLKIGSYIQSTTWDGTGNVGWHINKSGYAVFNNVTVRGGVYAQNGQFGFTNSTGGVTINNNGVTVNLSNGGRIVLGEF